MTPTHEPPIAGYRPGHHVCHTFQHDGERDASLIPFLREGLVRGERCLYSAAPTMLAHVETRLGDAGVDVARARARRALVLFPTEEAYGQRGSFKAEQTLSFIGTSIDACLSEGFTGLRGAGDLPYALRDDELDGLRAYEMRVNDSFVGRPFTALCCYSRMLLSEGAARDILHTHPQAWVDGELCPNPFFGIDLPPGDGGFDEPPLQLSQMLRTIGDRQRLRAQDRRLLTALAREAAELARVIDERTAALDERTQRDTDTIVALERHLAPLRLELQQLRLALRDGETPPPPAELSQAIERFWFELRGLSAVVRELRGPGADRPGT